MRLKKIKALIVANLLIISLLFIVGGFFIMYIDIPSTNGGKSFHQLTVAPILLLLGYSLIIFAIMNPQRGDRASS